MSFGCRVQTNQLFNLNDSTPADMLGLLRSSIPQTCDESSMRVDKGLLKARENTRKYNELHPSFRKLFTVIKKNFYYW